MAQVDSEMHLLVGPLHVVRGDFRTYSGRTNAQNLGEQLHEF